MPSEPRPITDNHLLASMPAAARTALQPHLSRVTLEKGQVLIEQGADVTMLHFPLDCDLSNVTLFSDGRAAETSTVGREGVSGLAAFLAREPNWWQVSVQTPGEAVAISAARLRAEVLASPELMDLVLRATYDYQCQSSQSAACNALHEVTPRLARWLLLVSDRARSPNLRLTQQDMATLLGAQRTTITAAAMSLRDARAIDYRRGSLIIRDRERLEGLACECYRMQRGRSQAMGLEPRT
jgi:CRP-like cAMP-binding protein